jgi:hypothetical protein
MVDYSEALPGKGKKIIIQYSGLFDFDGLYAAIIDWAKLYGFQWEEVDFKHKVPNSKGAEQEFKWAMHKKITDYVGNKINITVHMWDLLEVEVESGGKKKMLSNARLYLWLEPVVEFDWQKRFQEGGKLAKLLGKWYNKVMDREASNYLDQLYYRTWDLQAIIKSYFGMQSKKHAYKKYMGEN